MGSVATPLTHACWTLNALHRASTMPYHLILSSGCCRTLYQNGTPCSSTPAQQHQQMHPSPILLELHFPSAPCSGGTLSSSSSSRTPSFSSFS